VRAVERGAAVNASVDGLVAPFFEHASTRNDRARPGLAEAEAYVHALGNRLADGLT
jgi:hypothetical protein